jgi:protein-S-isoprenylcysteine O-methyltransferase Ste14
MALIEEFDKSGNWLFKKRSFIPLVLYAFAALLIWFEMDKDVDYTNRTWSWICIGVSMFGQLVRAITIGFTPRNTSGRNTGAGQVASVLNTKGIYSTVRHPLYFGNFFMWMGLVLYVGNWWFSIVAVLLFWLYYERIMFAEEYFLRSKFGQVYLDWSAKTAAFVPRIHRWVSSDMTFSFRNVLKREYSGFFAVFLSFALINTMKNYMVYKSLDPAFILDPFWMYLLAGSALIFVILRSLKKYSRVLHVEGR